MIGPLIGAIRVVTIHSPMAAGRRRSGNSRSINVCDSGISGPPVTPCRLLKPTSVSIVGDREHSSETTANAISAAPNTRAVPKRVASQPVRGTVIASATA